MNIPLSKCCGVNVQTSPLDRPECLQCGRYRTAILSPMMPMWGPSPCDILVVGEAPGKEDEKHGKPFRGLPGTLLQETFRYAKLENYKIAYTNSVRCWAPDPTKTKFNMLGQKVCANKGNKKPSSQEIKLCNGLLQPDLIAADAKLILLLGATALSAVLGKANITKMRGHVIRQDGKVYLPMYHPAFVMRDLRYKKTFRDDMLLAQKIMAELTGADTVIEMLRKRYEMVTTIERFDAIIDEALTKPEVSYDTEFNGLDAIAIKRVCYGVTFGWRRPGQRNFSCFIPMDHDESPFKGNQYVKDRIAEVLRSVPLVVHYMEADAETAIECFGLEIKDLTCKADTMREAQALHGPTASAALKTLCQEDAPEIAGYDSELTEFIAQSNIHRKILEDAKSATNPATPTQLYDALRFYNQHGSIFDGVDWGSIPLKIMANPYAAGDGDAPLQLDDKYAPRLDDTGQRWWFDNVFNKAWRVNLEIRRNGLLIDWDEWLWRWNYYRAEKERIYEEIRTYPKVQEFITAVEEQKKTFTLRSTLQMRQLLFTVLGFEASGNVTKTLKPQLDYSSLVEIQQKNSKHPDISIIDLLLEMARVDKLLGTYLEGYAKVMYEDGRVHPRVHNFTESGRRGTSAPNTQNTPPGDGDSDYALCLKAEFKAKYPEATKDEIYAMIKPLFPDNMRMLFRAAPGNSLVSWDYGQLEFRLAACYANDENMLAGCREGDPHKRVQDRFKFKNGLLDPLGEPMERTAAKRVNFGIIYECSAKRLRQLFKDDCGIELSLKQCEKIVRGMWALYPGLATLVEESHQQIRTHGWIANKLGHRRWLPHGKGEPPDADLFPDAYETWERAQREGGNHLEQSLGHDLLELAMQAMLDFIYARDLPWKLCNDAHDGFVIECPTEDVPTVAKLGKWFMEEMPKRVLGDWLQCELLAEVSVGTHLGALTVLKQPTKKQVAA